MSRSTSSGHQPSTRSHSSSAKRWTIRALLLAGAGLAIGNFALARERLKAVIKERDEAGNMAAGALRETSRNSPLKDTFWEKVQNVISDFGKWLEEHVKPLLDKISVALAVVTIAVTVLTGGAPV